MEENTPSLHEANSTKQYRLFYNGNSHEKALQELRNDGWYVIFDAQTPENKALAKHFQEHEQKTWKSRYFRGKPPGNALQPPNTTVIKSKTPGIVAIEETLQEENSHCAAVITKFPTENAKTDDYPQQIEAENIRRQLTRHMEEEQDKLVEEMSQKGTQWPKTNPLCKVYRKRIQSQKGDRKAWVFMILTTHQTTDKLLQIVLDKLQVTRYNNQSHFWKAQQDETEESRTRIKTAQEEGRRVHLYLNSTKEEEVHLIQEAIGEDLEDMKCSKKNVFIILKNKEKADQLTRNGLLTNNTVYPVELARPMRQPPQTRKIPVPERNMQEFPNGPSTETTATPPPTFTGNATFAETLRKNTKRATPNEQGNSENLKQEINALKAEMEGLKEILRLNDKQTKDAATKAAEETKKINERLDKQESISNEQKDTTRNMTKLMEQNSKDMKELKEEMKNLVDIVRATMTERASKRNEPATPTADDHPPEEQNLSLPLESTDEDEPTIEEESKEATTPKKKRSDSRRKSRKTQ